MEPGTDLLEGYWSCITALQLALIGDVNAGCAPAFLWNGKERANERTASYQATIVSRRSARGVRAPAAQGNSVRDYQASLEKLRNDAAEAALIRDLATDPAKRETFGRLHEHFNRLAEEVERAMSAAKTV
jgi:hypothetical protein